MDKISVIVPCYNEQETLPLFYTEINRVSKLMKKVDFEFIFINDGSKDNTLIQLREMAKNDKRVRYISFSRNFGKEAGMLAGLEHAKGDYVAIMDSDLQDPPVMLIDMYKTLTEENYDCCALYTKTHNDYSFLRRKLTNCWYKLVEVMSQTKQMPGARDYRLMNRKMVDAIISLREYNRYLKGIYSFVGFDTKWIEYETPERAAGDSKFNIIKLFKYALEGIVAFSTTPLVVSTIVGLILCLLAFIAIIVIIIKTLVWGDPVSGWPSLACMIMFMSGLQLFFFGVMGMYISKAYLEVKERPIYIVKETEKDK